MKTRIARQHAPPNAQRLRFTVAGTVQGVGFRPFVYRLAHSLELTGWIENTPQGVVIEAEGPPVALESFCTRLHSEAPPLCSIHSFEKSQLDPVGMGPFEIRSCIGTGLRSALVLPDIATCPDCMRECLDPRDRRYRYPFINCTHCGPRYSIIESLPYDRPNTSMKRFEMCKDCRREYEDPTDRRFHAQPIACPVCGPQLKLWSPTGQTLAGPDEAIRRAAAAIQDGKIIAMKGLGGFQLLADARDDDAVRELRNRKHREEKPFALMIVSLADVEVICKFTNYEKQLLVSPQAPIVLLRRRKLSTPMIAPNVAPSNPYLGLMLPYTPLHHLLVREVASPVVATSGNLSDEPLCVDETEALDRLRGIADLFLVHDRPIVRHVDDSVVRIINRRPMILRRARGYAPLPIRRPGESTTVLAVGAHQKNTVALARNGDIFLSQHIGDLVTEESVDAFKRAATDLPAFYDVTPEIIAHDLHPDYLSTVFAKRDHLPCVAVQHHHAHVTSCMAENDLSGEVLGVSWDGTGLGSDNTIWGGEFLSSTLSRFERIAHMRTFPLPGGERAATEPRRSALGLLHDALGWSAFNETRLPSISAFTATEVEVLRKLLASDRNCPRTSSAGRLFDAVASILGLRQFVRHEGQAAMELEFAAENYDTDESYPFRILQAPTAASPRIIDWQLMLERIVTEARQGQFVTRIARMFHNTLAEMIVSVAKTSGQERVVLTGGCFQNRLLSETTISRLRKVGLEPYWHQHVPPNDGGIALGQAVCARERLKESRSCA